MERWSFVRWPRITQPTSHHDRSFVFSIRRRRPSPTLSRKIQSPEYIRLGGSLALGVRLRRSMPLISADMMLGTHVQPSMWFRDHFQIILMLRQGYKERHGILRWFINVLASNPQHISHHASPNELKIHFLYLNPRPGCIACPWHTSIRYCLRSVLRHHLPLVIAK